MIAVRSAARKRDLVEIECESRITLSCFSPFYAGEFVVSHPCRDEAATRMGHPAVGAIPTHGWGRRWAQSGISKCTISRRIGEGLVVGEA
jgi:hypothetical protein